MKNILFILLLPIFTKAQIITTIAGDGTRGYTGDDIAATASELNYPVDVAIDGIGNVYIVDYGNSRIRKINTTGTIITIAGTGMAGYTGDGIAATASDLNNPTSVAVDGSGNVYIADAINNRIRKVNTLGIISTVAGNGTSGYTSDGIAATATELNQPSGVAVDGFGNVYIADAANSRIRKVNALGFISTIAGNGTSGYIGDGIAATVSELNGPSDVAIDVSGNVYIADQGNNRIRKVDTSGIIITVAGTGMAGYTGDGIAATASDLNNPTSVAVDGSGNVYIADATNNRIRKVNTLGIISTIAGSGTGGYTGDGIAATIAGLNGPAGIEVDDFGNWYIADFDNNRIRKVISSTTNVNTVNNSRNNLTIYPNPNNGVFSVILSSSYDEPVKFTITNITGEKVKEISGLTNKEIELQLDQPGIYFLSANTENYTSVGKVWLN